MGKESHASFCALVRHVMSTAAGGALGSRSCLRLVVRADFLAATRTGRFVIHYDFFMSFWVFLLPFGRHDPLLYGVAPGTGSYPAQHRAAFIITA